MIQYRTKGYITAINEHCERINNLINNNGTYDRLLNDISYRECILFNIIQIGECIVKISSEFKKQHDEISWKEISGMRNIVVHGYDKVDYKIVWDTCINDIPNLNKICRKIIDEYGIDTKYITIPEFKK